MMILAWVFKLRFHKLFQNFRKCHKTFAHISYVSIFFEHISGSLYDLISFAGDGGAQGGSWGVRRRWRHKHGRGKHGRGYGHPADHINLLDIFNLEYKIYAWFFIDY